MLAIGERLNATAKSVARAIASRDTKFVSQLAESQAEAGVSFIDVNVSTAQRSHKEQIEDMKWLVEVVQSATDKPLAIDSNIPVVIEAALKIYRGKRVMINSVNAEEDRLKKVARLAADTEAELVVLAMGAEGIPHSAEERLAACKLIVTHLNKYGIGEEKLYFDPLVLPISVDCVQAMTTLKTAENIKLCYPNAKTVIGLSNISYGLPNRKLINRAFLVMAAYTGVDAVILDPLDREVMSLIKVAEVLTGKDSQCRRYLRAHRRGMIGG